MMMNKSFLHFMLFKFVIMSIISLIWLETEIVTSLGHQFAAGRCIEKERNALLEFKDGFQDSDGLLSTWRAEYHCCKWSGVECNNKTGHVIKLDLRHFEGSLNGEISPSLINLSYLSHLDLGNKNFGLQPIPNFIGSLTKLRYLDLSFSTFNSNIPNSIGSLTELRYLNLSYNPLRGTIPNVIGSLTKLRYLDLSSSGIRGSVPFELGNLTNLRHLSLANSGSVKNLVWLSNLDLLQHLDMSGTPFTEPNHWLDSILRLRKLTYLSLNNCNLSQVTLLSSSFFVNSSVSIANLELSGNNLTSSAYPWLFRLTSKRLLHLDLSGNRLDWIPKYFGNLCGLKSLVIQFNLVVASFSDLLINLSGCTSISLQELDVFYSQFTGSVPSEIENFVSLKKLVLATNQLNGTISEKIWELPKLEYLSASFNYLRGNISKEFGNSKLRYIDLSHNALEGVLSEVHMRNLSNLEHLDLSLNYLSFRLSTHWIPPFQLNHIDLSSCKLGPCFPNWIQTQKNLSYLNLANSSISDIVPMEFWNVWPSQLRYLNLSFNNITGEVGDLSSKFVRYSAIDLSSNNFYGVIPKVPSNLVSLNLSRNKFYGGISFLCQIVDGLLSFLDLSRNSLNGKIPDCLSHFKQLIILNLSHNNLSGTIPTSIGSMVQLEVLYLCNNNFYGELPLLLKNCTKLNFLCLGANRFSGYVPTWIGNISELYGLSLRSNEFYGPIPSQICQLPNLQILDLSKNKLNGTIPLCLNNLTAMVEKGLSLEQTFHYYSPSYMSVGPDGRKYFDDYSNYIDYAMIEWQGNEREFRSINLGLLKSIDFSSNDLVGQIPDELTDLYEVLALNLSGNSLHGEIPKKIGELKSLLVLDFSRNNLSGRIPLSMSEMTAISYLDVSNNKLSGRIPSSTQLQSFDASRYTGNAGLCGPPVTRDCPGDETHEFTNVVFEDGGDEEDTDESFGWFYIGGSIGFATGFWIACGALLLNRRGRHAFFRMHAYTMDWMYLRMVLIGVKLRIVATCA